LKKDKIETELNKVYKNWNEIEQN